MKQVKLVLIVCFIFSHVSQISFQHVISKKKKTIDEMLCIGRGTLKP